MAVISICVGVEIGSWMMSDLMASISTPPPHTRRFCGCPFVEVSILVEIFRCQLYCG